MPLAAEPHPAAPAARLTPVPLAEIPRADWDILHARTPAATPFSRWTFHRAWWDAYAGTARESYWVLGEPDEPTGIATPPRPRPGDDPSARRGLRAIVPLMLRSAEERARDGRPDVACHLRREHDDTAGPTEHGEAVYMAASYHADYATILADARDLAVVSEALADALEGPLAGVDGPAGWECVDLRRLRRDDPLLDHLQAALERRAETAGWDVRRDVEEVCPVVTLAVDWESQLAGLGKKTRHEVRRKFRRAEAAGPVSLRYMPLVSASVERFVEMHQARWGADGLFPATEGGDRSRLFLHRLVELEAAEGSAAQLHLGEVLVGGRVVFALVGFDDGRTSYFYNAGMDPSARDLSPGVVGTAAYLRDRLEVGARRFDFLRGNEPYKYEWGAVDEPVDRILVHRSADR